MAKYILKKGTVHLFVNDKKVKLRPGDTVECADWEMPDGFKSSFKEIVPEGEVRATEAEPDAELPNNFKVVHKGSGKYAVVNVDTEEVLNSVLLSRSEAYELAGIPDPKTEVQTAAEEGFNDALEGDEDMARE